MSLGQFALLNTALAVGMPAGLASLVLQAQVAVTVLLSALLLRERPTRQQLLGVAVGVIGLAVVALSLVIDGPEAVGEALADPGRAAVLSTLYTAWLASLVGYGIWNTLLARHPAAAVVPFAMLVPVVGLTTAWAVQGEVPNGWEAAGGVLLLLGVAITTGLVRARRPRAARADGRDRTPAR